MDSRTDYALSQTSPALARKQLHLLMTQPELNSSNQTDVDISGQDEEIKEVATQLSLIRKRHDEAKETNAKKKAHLAHIKREIEGLDSFKNLTETDSLSVQHRIDQLSLVLDSVKLKHEEELQQKRVYEQMLDRMRADKLCLDTKAHQVNGHLRSARHAMETEKEKSRKMKETKFQSKMLLSEFKEITEFERRKRDERLMLMERNLKMRQDQAVRREERKQRQGEIAEAAASEDKDASEIRCKDTLMLHRLWYRMLKYKLDLEKEGSAEIERAFQQIKMVTGLNDINEITQSFVNREQTYQGLLASVAESEAKLDELKAESLVARDKLKELQLAEMGSRGLHSDVQELEQKIAVVSKENASAKEKLQNGVLIYDSVLGWTKKIMKKLELDPDELEVLGGMRVQESTYRLADLFAKILGSTEVLCSHLAENIEDTRQEMEQLAAKRTDTLVVRVS